MLPLPITPADALVHIIVPALRMLPPEMDTRPARVMSLATALQESDLAHRRQVRGPATGLWQFERGGGVRAVLSHHGTRLHALAVCEARGVAPTSQEVHEMLEHDDHLACAFARLLLWTDPVPLPPIDYTWTAWDAYIRTWQPGKPHRERWAACHARAVSAVEAMP